MLSSKSQTNLVRCIHGAMVEVNPHHPLDVLVRIECGNELRYFRPYFPAVRDQEALESGQLVEIGYGEGRTVGMGAGRIDGLLRLSDVKANVRRGNAPVEKE
jgi:hypothetical protein